LFPGRRGKSDGLTDFGDSYWGGPSLFEFSDPAPEFHNLGGEKADQTAEQETAATIQQQGSQDDSAENQNRGHPDCPRILPQPCPLSDVPE